MRRALRPLAILVPAALLAAQAHAVERPSYDAYFDLSFAAAAPTTPPVASSRLGAVASIDPRRGVPSFLWAAPAPAPPVSASPEAAARRYLVDRAALWGVPPAALDAAELVRIHDVGRGGVLAIFRQRRGGVEVFRGELKVLMRKSLELVAISGSPRGLLAAETKRGGHAFTLPAGEAVARAFADLYEVPLSPASLVEGKARGGYRALDLGPAPEIAHTGIRFVAPARVKKVFFALPDRLVPAYFLEIQAGKATETVSDAYAYVIGAADGRVLYRRSLTQADSFDYRVWADADKRPLDGPQADYSPHPTGIPDGSSPAFISPVLVSMEGFNTNPNAVADPWLPAGAAESLGNNVDAYSDHSGPDGFTAGDLRATTTGPSIFDRVFDTGAEPLATQDQTRAAVTQLFYTTNWLHDWFYDSGFDEAAGNAQADNFGRGGLGGDVMHAEAQDGALAGSRNNANMSTPADGESPRMQMFLWDAVSSHSLSVQPLGLTPPSGAAPFGPQSFDVTALLALANDGAAPATDACEPLVGGAAGAIVLVDRGACTFVSKAQRAQTAGAVGVIIANNVANAGPAPLAGSGAVGIPVLSISLEDGNALKAALQNGAQTATMSRAVGVERDGTIDNTIIAHEWGHYLHHRLVECGLRQCNGESEGWGDFIALTMFVRPGDDLDGTFAMAGYASAASGDSGYFGLRRFPYSVDFSKNALTFKHISSGEPLPNVPSAPSNNDNSEVHNAGEIWATMLFEGFVALLKKSAAPMPPYSFEEARRRMSDYVVAGLALAPIEPTFTQQRDAILAAAYAADPLDMLELADAFAARGAGSCAVSPPADSTDLTGVVESYSTGSNFTVLSAAIDDAVLSCDGDGVLDAEEIGEVTVEVMNTGLSPLMGASVTVSAPTPGVSFPDGPSTTLAAIEPFAVGVAKIRIGLDASVSSIGYLDLTATVNEPTACGPPPAGLRAHAGRRAGAADQLRQRGGGVGDRHGRVGPRGLDGHRRSRGQGVVARGDEPAEPRLPRRRLLVDLGHPAPVAPARRERGRSARRHVPAPLPVRGRRDDHLGRRGHRDLDRRRHELAGRRCPRRAGLHRRRLQPGGQPALGSTGLRRRERRLAGARGGDARLRRGLRRADDPAPLPRGQRSSGRGVRLGDRRHRLPGHHQHALRDRRRRRDRVRARAARRRGPGPDGDLRRRGGARRRRELGPRRRRARVRLGADGGPERGARRPRHGWPDVHRTRRGRRDGADVPGRRERRDAVGQRLGRRRGRAARRRDELQRYGRVERRRRRLGRRGRLGAARGQRRERGRRRRRLRLRGPGAAGRRRRCRAPHRRRSPRARAAPAVSTRALTSDEGRRDERDGRWRRHHPNGGCWASTAPRTFGEGGRMERRSSGTKGRAARRLVVVLTASLGGIAGCKDGPPAYQPQQVTPTECTAEQRAAIRQVMHCFQRSDEQVAEAEASCDLSMPHVATLTGLVDPSNHFPTLKLWYSPSTPDNRTEENVAVEVDDAGQLRFVVAPRAGGEGHQGLTAAKGTIDDSCEIEILSQAGWETVGQSFGTVDVHVRGTYATYEPAKVPTLEVTLSGGEIPGDPITYQVALSSDAQGTGGAGGGGGAGGAGGAGDALSPENLEALTGAGLPATCVFVEERDCPVATFTAALTVRVSAGTVELVQMPGSQTTDGPFYGGVKFSTGDAAAGYDERYLGEFFRTTGTDPSAPLTPETVEIRAINASGAQGSLAGVGDSLIATALDAGAHDGNTAAIDALLAGTSGVCVYDCTCTFGP